MDIQQLYPIFLWSRHVTTDSRQVKKGTLFFALRGDRYDGNLFAAQALADGASYAVVDNPDVVKDDRYILVEDALQTLQELALHHRRQFHIPIIAITGSNGKTTTKELVAAVMGSHYPIHFTQGNLNNHIGVPLTLLGLSAQTEVAVIEMGANHQGEIDALCRIAEPTHGLITNIGKAHLEGFGGIEGVKRGKSELYRFLAEQDGLVFINQDEPFLTELATPVRKRVYYRQSAEPSMDHHPIEVKLLQTQPFLKVAFLQDEGDLLEVQTHLVGTYNLSNLMAAIALGKYFKVPSLKIKAAIEAYIPGNNRSQLVPWGTNTLLLDAYNANPTSMEHALQSFAQLAASRKVVLLGDMFEVGEEGPKEHQRIAELASTLGFDDVVLIGSLFAAPAQALGLLHFPNAVALRTWFREQAWENTHVLIKGSRGMRLESILTDENTPG